MKYFALLLLCSLSVVLVVAFPSDHASAAALPAAGLHADATPNAGAEPDDIADSPSAWIRQPRHLLKKLFHVEPQVVVQPVVVQAAPFYPNQPGLYNIGRSYNGGYSNGVYFNRNLGYL
ncbi:hypothetical protein KR222_004463 [Zaprionus bogoriensis]|nr:hypothetical protein KR222_004463 [Zaprionus bogoriensis]